MSRGVFLSAEWRSLVMLNYEVDPEILTPFLPAGLELDEWQGRTLVSMVGFRFLRTRLLGCPIPFHRDFPEVNLRFYVRRKCRGEWRRGVVFVREIVPRRAIAAVARFLYGERYVRCPMRHSIAVDAGEHGRAEYAWFSNGRWHTLGASFSGPARPIPVGSEAEFIFEHYWGYARQRNGATVEYEVRHPRWRAWEAREVIFDCHVANQYGQTFAPTLSAAPVSAFVAEGSEVEVLWGTQCSAAPAL
jgi:uncharacterized protein YqjF (DUF2071 family)